METKKVLIKTAYCLAGLSVLLIIGFMIFQHQRIKRLSQNTTQETVIINRSRGDGISTPVETDEKSFSENTGPIDKEKESYAGIIDDLEFQFDAAEGELDMADKQFSDAELKSLRSPFQKSDYSDPIFEKMQRDSQRDRFKNVFKERIDVFYGLLFNMLGLSNEKTDKLKELLAERQADIIVLRRFIGEASSPNEEAELKQRLEGVIDKHDNSLTGFLGEEKLEIFQAYEDRLFERVILSGFIASFLPENSISEEQVENLVGSMYKAQKIVQAEIGYDDEDIRFRPDLTEEEISRQMKLEARIIERYADVSTDVLSPDKVEEFKAFLEMLADRSIMPRIWGTWR